MGNQLGINWRDGNEKHPRGNCGVDNAAVNWDLTAIGKCGVNMPREVAISSPGSGWEAIGQTVVRI